MVLKLEDFSCFIANWNDKCSNIRNIAVELNIGIDSIVFFDDNPVERDWVRNQLHDVKVIEVPKNSINYLKALNESTFFDVRPHF